MVYILSDILSHFKSLSYDHYEAIVIDKELSRRCINRLIQLHKKEYDKIVTEECQYIEYLYNKNPDDKVFLDAYLQGDYK